MVINVWDGRGTDIEVCPETGRYEAAVHYDRHPGFDGDEPTPAKTERFSGVLLPETLSALRKTWEEASFDGGWNPRYGWFLIADEVFPDD